MLIGRRKHFVIEVMEQADKPPLVDISVRSTVTRRARTHRSLNRQRMLPQALAFGVLAQQLPGFCSTRHRLEKGILRLNCEEKTITSVRAKQPRQSHCWVFAR